MDECVINVEVFGGLNNENFSEVEFDWKGRLRRLWEESGDSFSMKSNKLRKLYFKGKRIKRQLLEMEVGQEKIFKFFLSLLQLT